MSVPSRKVMLTVAWLADALADSLSMPLMVLSASSSGRTIRRSTSSVATVLEGGVQRSGNRVRINVQLIAAARDETLWAETYDRELTAANIFDIQSDISRMIANRLRATLTADEEQRLDAVPTKERSVRIAMSNSFGFGGTNATLVFAQVS